ncbi:hypothetical protein MASR1M31_19960 [Porphyromonadaceae bacterium]
MTIIAFNTQNNIALMEKLIYICEIILISNHYVHTIITELTEHGAAKWRKCSRYG